MRPRVKLLRSGVSEEQSCYGTERGVQDNGNRRTREPLKAVVDDDHDLGRSPQNHFRKKNEREGRSRDLAEEGNMKHPRDDGDRQKR